MYPVLQVILLIGIIWLGYFLYKSWIYCPTCHQTRVLFFPDSAYPCISFYLTLMNKRKINCNRIETCTSLHGYSHEEASSLMEVFKVLNKAKKTVKLCMYLITNEWLAKFLVHLSQVENVSVRIVTDSAGDNKMKMMNKVRQLQEAGIEIKTNDQAGEALMHNKFVIIDNKTIILGSFNWTGAAILKNDEAVLITSQQAVISKFNEKFEQMWEKFKPVEYSTPQI